MFGASDAPSRSISISSASTRKPSKNFCIRLSSLIAKTSAHNFLFALKRFRLLTAVGRAVAAAAPANHGSASSSSAKPKALHDQSSTVYSKIRICDTPADGLMLEFLLSIFPTSSLAFGLMCSHSRFG